MGTTSRRRRRVEIKGVLEFELIGTRLSNQQINAIIREGLRIMSEEFNSSVINACTYDIRRAKKRVLAPIAKGNTI